MEEGAVVGGGRLVTPPEVLMVLEKGGEPPVEIGGGRGTEGGE
jgi:hypothetical protein